MIKFLLGVVFTLRIADLVISQPDLCQNPRLDSIAYIADKKMYFFTSGGYYWLLKDNEFPPTQDKAKPLPNGFKTGEAAIYMNTMKTCALSPNPNRPQEHEVYVMEKTADGNKFMIYDVRSQTWKQPENYEANHYISKARIDWNLPIDAMFEYNPREIYVVQAAKYAAIQYVNVCNNPDNYADPYEVFSTDHFGTRNISAMTLVEPNTLYMFFGDLFWPIIILPRESANGKIVGRKQSSRSLKTEFFKFTEVCQTPIGGSAADTSPKIDESVATVDGRENTSEPSESSGSSGGSGALVIFVIVVIVVVLTIVGVVVFLLMGKKKTESDPTKPGTETSKVPTAPKPGESNATVKSKTGTPAAPVTAPKSTNGQTKPKQPTKK